MQALRDYLNLSLYGQGQAKTWEELEAEIRSGECQIEWICDRPVRMVNVACVQVMSHRGERLVEDHQELSDGRIRQRGLTELSEKFKPNELPIEAAQRALVEELGIDDALTLETLQDVIEEKESISYPGLLSRYHIFFFKVSLPEVFYKPEYIEIQKNKRTIFKWARQ